MARPIEVRVDTGADTLRSSLLQMGDLIVDKPTLTSADLYN